MHDVIHMVWRWVAHPENRLMDFLVLSSIIGGLVVLGTSAYDAWQADRRWLGCELRRKRRRSEREPP
jgi:hypothetical protein